MSKRKPTSKKKTARSAHKQGTTSRKDQQGRVIHELKPGCDPKGETAVPYYQAMGDVCEKHFGRRPCRQSLWRYLEYGFPVRQHGPYVMVPIFHELNRPMTTRETMSRFVTVVKYLRTLRPKTRA